MQRQQAQGIIQQIQQLHSQMQQMQQQQQQQQQQLPPPDTGTPSGSPSPAPGQDDPQAQALQQMQSQIQSLMGQLEKIKNEPTIEQVLKFLSDNRARSFTLDIETDSTIMVDEKAEKKAPHRVRRCARLSCCRSSAR